MTLLLDTADINGAHACGYDREHGINSDDRLLVFYEFGEFTVVRGRRQVVLSAGAFAKMVEWGRGPNPLDLTASEREALCDVLDGVRKQARRAA